MNFRIRSILLITLACGCASESHLAQPDPDLALTAAAMQVRFGREASLMEPFSVSSEDGFFHVTVGARLAGKIKQGVEGYRLKFDFGASTPASCLIAREKADLASWISLSSTHFFESLKPPLAGDQHLLTTHAGTVDEVPYIGVSWVLGSSYQDGTQSTQVKFLAANKQEAAITCIHNEAGYNRSFQRLFEDLISSFTSNRVPAPAPFYHEIHRFSIAGRHFGVRSTTFSHEPDGNITITTLTSMIVPIDSKTIQANDTTERAAADQDGMLLSKSHLSVQNGELATHLKVEPDASAGWLVTGIFGTQPINVTLSSPKIVSTLGQMQIAQQALQEEGVGAIRSFPLWVADAGPGRTIVGTLHALEQISEGTFLVEFLMGPVTTRGVTELNGSIQSADIKMGPAQIHVERVYQKGEI
jgi:hypothetical protein